MDAQLRAITDPTRREILSRLTAGERSAGEIATLFDVTRPAISHHLGVLRDAGLITVRREAQSRLYSIDAAAVAELRLRFNRFWDDALPKLKSAAESRQRTKRRKKRSKGRRTR